MPNFENPAGCQAQDQDLEERQNSKDFVIVLKEHRHDSQIADDADASQHGHTHKIDEVSIVHHPDPTPAGPDVSMLQILMNVHAPVLRDLIQRDVRFHDAEAVKTGFLGSWEGKTSFGARLRVTFDHTDKLAGYNVTKDQEFTRKYLICGPEAIWFAGNGVQVTASVSENRERLIIKYNMGDTPVVDTFAKKP